MTSVAESAIRGYHTSSNQYSNAVCAEFSPIVTTKSSAAAAAAAFGGACQALPTPMHM